jgi:PRC-barrel domain
MSKSNRHIPVASTVSALAMFALTGAACAQDTTDKMTYESQPTDAQKMESAMDQHADMAKKGIEDAHTMATTFGVSELNDIENWKVTNGGQEIGEIDRIGVDRATGELLAVVGLKGVVGVNMKEVGVPLKRLAKAGDETLSTDLTKDELQAQRDIDPWDGTYSQVLKDKSSQ